MRGTGRRRAGEDNVRLRQRVANLADDLAWHRRRLMDVTARSRALHAHAEIVDGERLLDQQLIYQQTAELAALNAENEELRRRLQAGNDETVETPIITDAQLAGVA